MFSNNAIMHEKTSGIKNKYLLIIILLYLVANFFLFLNNGLYWDDWCLSSDQGIRDICNGAGIPFMIPIHIWMINLTSHPAILYHILIGLIGLLIIFLFYKCLCLLNIKQTHAFLISLFFALIPYNQAKITLACFMYIAGLFFFLSAIYLFIYFRINKIIVVRIFSLIFFLISFTFLPSTLVLSLAVLLFLAIYDLNINVKFNKNYFSVLLKKVFTWFDFFILPFVFWVFRAFFLKPTGVYESEGYREFSISSVLLTPVNIFLTFIQNFLGLGTVTNSLKISNIFIFVFVAIFILLLIILKNFRLEPVINRKRSLIIGLYLFVAGAFAYVMVGLQPTFDGFSSRHQILLGFGSSLLLFYLATFIISEKAQNIFIAIIISLFIVSTITCQLQHQKSWFKQLALEKLFAKEKVLDEGINFKIIDNTLEYNEYNEGYRFYCYTGILKKTFGTQTRFAINSNDITEEFSDKNSASIVKSAYHNMKDCRDISTFKYIVLINKGSLLLSNKQNLVMLYQYYFSKNDFDTSVGKILELKVILNN